MNRRSAIAALSAMACMGSAGGARGATPDALVRQAQPSPRAAQAVLLAIARTKSRVIAAGERGVVIYSDDEGATWTQAQVPVSTSLTNLCLVDARHGWAVGHGGVVLSSSDAGATWRLQLDGSRAARLIRDDAARAGQSTDPVAQKRLADAQRLVDEGPDKPFLCVHFENEQRGLIGGAFGMLLATEDGGATWQAATQRIDNPQGKHLYGIQDIGGILYVVGEQGALFRSTDHGRSFSTLASPYAGTFFGITGTPHGGTVVAYGLRGNVYRSEDGVSNWQRSPSATDNSLTAAVVTRTGRLLLTDETGRLVHSTDDGRTFQRVDAASAMPSTGLVESSNGSILLTGARGVSRLTIPVATNATR